MEQYISKSALMAEIEKRIKETESMQPKFDQFWAGQISAFKGVLQILNTYEVKEVDLNDEIMKYQREIYDRDTTVRDVAKYFYELGIKAQKGE